MGVLKNCWHGHFKAVNLFVILLCAEVFACPMFVEFFPDPKDVPDAEGEFVEIRLDDFRSDSLYVKFEDKQLLAFPFPEASRLLLVHDSLQCPHRDSLACGYLGKISLPNSRESSWKLWSGSCKDSVTVPVPKPGMSFQRIGEGNEFALTSPSPGTGNPDYELGIFDCAVRWGKIDHADGVWHVGGFLKGCDSTSATLSYLALDSPDGWKNRALNLDEVFRLDVEAAGAVLIRLTLPPDGVASNDVVDTLLVGKNSPAYISEVHHCPAEPEPEWIEIYNGSRHPLALAEFSFCQRGKEWALPLDSLAPYASLIVTKDSSELRDFLGFSDVPIAQAAIGYLNNVSGSISLCFNGVVLDSVSWNKGTVDCPAGFSPRLRRSDNSPGFQRSSSPSQGEDPFQFKLSSRVVSKKGQPLRALVTSDNEVKLQLLDSAGRSLWKKNVPPSSSWWNVPAQEMCSVGVCYVSFAVGSFEKVVGIVLRP